MEVIFKFTSVVATICSHYLLSAQISKSSEDVLRQRKLVSEEIERKTALLIDKSEFKGRVEPLEAAVIDLSARVAKLEKDNGQVPVPKSNLVDYFSVGDK